MGREGPAAEEADESKLDPLDKLPTRATSKSTYASRILNLTEAHEKWRGNECLNLIPSENVTSPNLRRLLTNDMGHRYRADDNFYRGTKYMDELESTAEELASKVFGSDWASLRPLSGHVADMIAVSTLTQPGDSILMVGPDDGGYEGLGAKGGYTEYARTKNLFFPYNRDRMQIMVDESNDLIEREKPRLVVFGQSYFLFPHPVKELKRACESVEASIVYDGSHVLGLIAGNEFQKPFVEGADLLLGSTHKSFFGPQGGVILGRENVRERVRDKQRPGLIDNAHWNRIAALAWALDEFRRVGREYARQVIANSKELAKTLDESGVPVKCADYGYTMSHQVMLDISDPKEIDRLGAIMEKANLIIDRGIRLGTNELTRRGMKQREMQRVGELVAEIYKGKDPEKLRKRVVRLRKEFPSLRYT